jgi:hypothetical protein
MRIASRSYDLILRAFLICLMGTAPGLAAPPALAQDPGDIVGMDIAGNDDVYVWLNNGIVSSGVTSQLQCHRKPANYEAAPGRPGQDGKTAADVVGIAVACKDGHTFVWYRDGTVSAGSSGDFDEHRKLYRYSLPPDKKPTDIVGIGIADDDHVYAWYSDLTVSSGTSDDLDKYRAPYAYSLAPGKTPDDVVGIAIACQDGHTFVWYRDGTVSAGTSADLDSYRAPYSYSLPSGNSPADIVEMGIASDDHVFAWYSNNTVSSGTTGDLDRYRAPYKYTLVPTIAEIVEKDPGDIVDIGIACSDDQVFAWYDDRTVSAGTSTKLGASRKLYDYSLPAGKTPSDIVGIAIAKDDHVFAWYKDRTVSSGTSDDLDQYRKPYDFSLPQGKTVDDIVAMGIACSNNHVYAWYRDGTVSSGTSDDLGRHRDPYHYDVTLIPPAAPSNLTISETGNDSLTLAWKDNSSCETRFRIEERIAGKWKKVAEAGKQDVDRNDEHYKVNNVSGGEHCYRVKATNSAGASEASNVVCGQTTQRSGFSDLLVSNCHDDRRTVHVWTQDQTDGGEWKDRGSVKHQWSNDQCPVGDPFELKLTDGHRHQIVIVDPGAISCGGANDPKKVACQKVTLPNPVLGYVNGPSYPLRVE